VVWISTRTCVVLDPHFDDVDEGNIKNLETNSKPLTWLKGVQEPPIKLMVKRTGVLWNVPWNQSIKTLKSQHFIAIFLIRSIFRSGHR
jgi:hypothetical protein